jgi:hypothetical protein
MMPLAKQHISGEMKEILETMLCTVKNIEKASTEEEMLVNANGMRMDYELLGGLIKEIYGEA